MKKHWLFLVLAAFLVLAPAASADDGSVFGSLETLLGRLVALFSGDGAELGSEYPPGGLTTSDKAELGHHYPPHGVTSTGDEPEIGDEYPPNGVAATGDEPEIGDQCPPNG